jgi:hypothetical protein
MMKSLFGLLLILLICAMGLSQQRDSSPYPGEIRGYKVHRARVEPKQSTGDRERRVSSEEKDEYDETEPLFIRLGDPVPVEVSPLGVTFDVPVILPAVKQSGEVERLVFEDMRVNDIPVSLADYAHKFKLPNKEPLRLMPPIRIFLSTPQAVVRTIDEILNSRDVWAVTGRIYVCGRYKKFLLKFKRAVPVELDTTIRNPLRD